MKYAIMLPPPNWIVEFDTFEEAVAWMRANRGHSRLFGPNFSGPEDKTDGLTPEEMEALEEMS